MAMTGGTAVLLKSTTPSGFGSHKVNLYAYYKYTQSTDTNKTTMLLGMYVTTDSGWDIGSWSDSRGSYIGTTSNTFDGTIPNFSGTRWLTENQQMIVSHNDEGKATATIQWKWGVYSTWGGYTNPSGSFTVELPQIARASAIDSAVNVTLGNACSVKWTPKASTFRYKLKFAMGSWSHTTGAIHPNKTSAYTYSDYVIPLSVASQIPNEKSGAMTVTLYTYSDSGATKQVGSADCEVFYVIVPDNADTKPTVSMSLSPVGVLPSAFAGLYLQGLTKVKATLSAQGKYGAAINTYLMKVDGIYHDSSDAYTSSHLTTVGTSTVYGYATDYRGHTGEKTQDITVLPYSDPKLENASAVRCDKDGNETESGTYLKIHAKRSYSPVVSDGVQKNFCKIQYRYSADGNEYTSWETILESNHLDRDEVSTDALLDGSLSTQASYTVHIRAIDDIGRYAETYITVPTEKVYMHRDGARNAIGLGKYNERDNGVDSAWDFYMNGHMITGLPEPLDDTAAAPKDYVDRLFGNAYFAYRDHCKDADEAKLSGVYRLTGESTNVPNNNGIMLVFNCSDNESPSPVWQVAMDYNGANRKCRMMWYGNTPTGWTDL